MAADDLALLAHRLDRRSYLHGPFRLESGAAALAAVAAAATRRGTLLATRNYAPKSAPRDDSSGGGSGPRADGLSGGRSLAVDVPRREHPPPAGLDGHGELEMGGQGPILGEDRPVVVAHPHGVATRGDHRFDGQDHALLQQRAPSRLAEVGDLGVLVHVAADAVSH